VRSLGCFRVYGALRTITRRTLRTPSCAFLGRASTGEDHRKLPSVERRPLTRQRSFRQFWGFPAVRAKSTAAAAATAGGRRARHGWAALNGYCTEGAQQAAAHLGSAPGPVAVFHSDVRCTDGKAVTEWRFGRLAQPGSDPVGWEGEELRARSVPRQARRQASPSRGPDGAQSGFVAAALGLLAGLAELGPQFVRASEPESSSDVEPPDCHRPGETVPRVAKAATGVGGWANGRSQRGDSSVGRSR